MKRFRFVPARASRHPFSNVPKGLGALPRKAATLRTVSPSFHVPVRVGWGACGPRAEPLAGRYTRSSWVGRHRPAHTPSPHQPAWASPNGPPNHSHGPECTGDECTGLVMCGLWFACMRMCMLLAADGGSCGLESIDSPPSGVWKAYQGSAQGRPTSQIPPGVRLLLGDALVLALSAPMCLRRGGTHGGS